MCQKIHTNNKTVSLPVHFIGFIVVFGVLLFIDSAGGRNEIKKSRGACLSYGHACWGAHGKRSGQEIPIFPVNHNNNNNNNNEEMRRRFDNNGKSKTTRWFLSRLLTPMDLRFVSNDVDDRQQKDNDASYLILPKLRGEIRDLFMEKEGEKRLNDLENIDDLKGHSDDDAIENGQDLENFFHYRKSIEKRSIKS